MSLTLDIAKRYLFGKKSTNAINLITGISILGISIGSAALILILSVFNGFESLIAGLLNDFNPDLKLIPKEGKFFSLEEGQLDQIKRLEDVRGISKTLEEIAFFEYKGAQVVGAVKGVDKEFRNVSNIDSSIHYGSYVFKKDEVNYGLVGARLHNLLSINQSDALTPLRIHMPTNKKKGLIKKDYKTMMIYPSGIFSVQSEKEDQYLICSLTFAEKLLDKKDKFSSLEIAFAEDANEKLLRKDLLAILGDKFIIQNRYQQDEAFLKLMNIEKWISFFIVSLTLLIVAFNMVGSLWMIVLDKKRDIAILKSVGFNKKDVKRIFLYEGLLISGIGLIIGICLAILLYLLQTTFGLVPVPEGFIIDAYPIRLKLFDFVVVIISVIAIGYLASILPARRAESISPYMRQD